MRSIVNIFFCEKYKWDDCFMFFNHCYTFSYISNQLLNTQFCVIIIMIDRDFRCERSFVSRKLSRFLFNFDWILFEWIELTFSFFLCLQCNKHILDLQFDCKQNNSTSTKCRDCVRRHQSCFSMKKFSY